MTWLTDDDYKERYPDRPKMSLDTDSTYTRYFCAQPDMTAIGEFLYLKEVPRTLVLMFSGVVLRMTTVSQGDYDEMVAVGITEVSAAGRKTGLSCEKVRRRAGLMSRRKRCL